MRVQPTVFADPGQVGAAVARRVLDRIAAARTAEPDRPFVLGCPGGRSASSSYAALARLAADGRADLSRLVILMMDEYVVPGPDGPAPVDDREPHSCRRFGREQIAAPLLAAQTAAGVPVECRIDPDALRVPDPADPEAYETALDEWGGVDLFLLASGASDGHVAFNPPGTARGSRTRVVALPDSTRTDNLSTFPSFGGRLDAVPDHGVTVGVGTIRDRSAEVIMIVHGADKRAAVTRLSGAAHYEPDWPATVLTDCRSPHLFVDRASLGLSPEGT